MRSRSHSSILAGLLLLLGLGMVLAGCFGGSDTAENVQSLQVRPQSQTTTLSTVGLAMTVSPANAYSTFRSKDPFIQQAVPPSTTSTAPVEPAPTSTVSTTTTTTVVPSTTTTSPSTTTTAFFLHLLQVLWAGTVDGNPAVTFQVDNNVYQNARIGDVISTSWGQIKVVAIEVDTQIVTLLHGSETLVLLVGQVVFQ